MRPIVYATDERGLPLYELSRAVLRKACPGARVILLADFDGRSDDAEVVNVSGILRDLGLPAVYEAHPHLPFPPMCVARLVLPLLEEVAGDDACLYLDTDTLVVDAKAVEAFRDGPVNPDADLVGVRDWKLSVGNRRIIQLANAVGADAPATLVEALFRGRYLNSGVLLFNLDRLRRPERNYRELLRRMLRTQVDHGFRFVDQDLVNMFLSTRDAGRPEMNSLTGERGEPPGPNVAIAHYAGKGSVKRTFVEYAEKLLGL